MRITKDKIRVIRNKNWCCDVDEIYSIIFNSVLQFKVTPNPSPFPPS